MKVIFLCKEDWAGSCYQAAQAVNQFGQHEAIHIMFAPHPFKYPFGFLNPSKDELFRLFENVDLVHLWNNEISAFKGLGVPASKVKSITWTGSKYRREHSSINQNTAHLATVFQNPQFREFNPHAEFIPHAVDTELIKPIPIEKRIPNSMGLYSPKHKNSSARADIEFLKNALGHNWIYALENITDWKTRLGALSKCYCFFEYMDNRIGYWGRSAIEACAFGIPTFSYVSQEIMELTENRVGVPAIMHIDKNNIRDRVNSINENYAEISASSRKWIEDYYSYSAVGKLYNQLFNRL